MKNRFLIQELQMLDPELEVVLPTGKYGVSTVKDVNEGVYDKGSGTFDLLDCWDEEDGIPEPNAVYLTG